MAEKEQMEYLKTYFGSKLASAFAKLTGDPLDELFASPEKAIIKFGEWIKKELSDEDLLREFYHRAETDRLIELRTQYVAALRIVNDELNDRIN